MASAYKLRPVTLADEALLLRLYASGRSDAALLEAWSGVQRESLLRSQFTLQRRHYESSFPTAEHEIILIEGQPVGRLWMDWCGDEARCLDVVLLPAWRGAGLGGRIFEDLKTEAASRGLPLTLNVEHGNPAAKRFYTRQGFREIRDMGTHAFLEWVPPKAP